MSNNIPTQFVLPLQEIARLPNNKMYRLLDIGAATKEIEKFLPEHIMYYSLDNVGDHDYEFDLDDGRMPFKSGVFDIVLCLETLEHVKDPASVLNEIQRISKDDARIYLSMLNEYNLWLRLLYFLGIKDEMKEPFEVVNKHLHIHLPRVKDILRLFRKHFIVSSIHYGWNSCRAPKIFDKIISKLSNIWPSLFTRLVVVSARKYTIDTLELEHKIEKRMKEISKSA